jgi:hypothetical protein
MVIHHLYEIYMGGTIYNHLFVWVTMISQGIAPSWIYMEYKWKKHGIFTGYNGLICFFKDLIIIEFSL